MKGLIASVCRRSGSASAVARGTAVALALLVLATGETAASWRFVVMGDNRPDWESPVEPPPVFHTIIDRINALRPRAEFVIHTGDVIVGYTKDRRFLAAQFDAFEREARRLRCPMYIAVGNHEDFDAESQRMYVKRFGRLSYAEVLHGCGFVFLDSVSYQPEEIYAKFGEPQLAWLDKTLASYAGLPHRFVAFHVPVFASPAYRNWLEGKPETRDRVTAIFEKHKVTAVFQGHVHTYDEGEQGGVRYFISGGGGANQDTPGLRHHFVIVDVDGDRVTTAVHYLGAAAFRADAPARAVKSGGALADWDEDDGTWAPYERLVRLRTVEGERGTRALRMSFNAARSHWPMVTWTPPTLLDLSGVTGLAFRVFVHPRQLARGTTLTVRLKVANRKSDPVPLREGEWQDVAVPFDKPVWEDKHDEEKKSAFAAGDRKKVDDLTIGIDIQEPGKEWWQMTTSATVDIGEVTAL